MNKKFMVVALMAALSTVGFAADYTNEQIDNKVTDALQGALGYTDNVVTELEGKFNDKVTDALQGALGYTDNVVTDINNRLEGYEDVKENANSAIILGQENKDKIEANQGAIADLNSKLEGYEDVKENANSAIILGQENKAEIEANKDAIAQNKNDITDINNRLEGYEDVKENANSAIILGQENKAEIEANKDAIAQNKNDIAANKAEIERVDKENKDQQAAIDKNTSDITTNRNDIEALQQNFAQYDGRLSGLEKKVDHLDDKMNKGLSLMAAMNAVDFQNVQTGEMALGAGIGHYGNAQSVALGVAYAPVEDLTVNAKYSITAGDPDSFAVGAGATYKFKVGR